MRFLNGHHPKRFAFVTVRLARASGPDGRTDQRGCRSIVCSLKPVSLTHCGQLRALGHSIAHWFRALRGRHHRPHRSTRLMLDPPTGP